MGQNYLKIQCPILNSSYFASTIAHFSSSPTS
ncbi:unnamed protein product [Staphylococcus haemolyticus JCSC1435]|uniref:Uncharacterized protein n=1 Tax=Staphylococcus haemolyticus (strain JCSC1435) TaxID=279808 RepID=Q4L972_STAHJ|nr:unnamed protein product [Staphylococcus haemolyticus JCSC1435]